jgi:hypothetical protein
MAFSRKSLFAFLLATLAWCVQPAAANDVYEATVSEMLAEQAQRIQQLETHLASLDDKTKLHADGCDDDCCDICPGVIGGAELTFVKAHSNALTRVGPGGGGGLTLIPEFDYEVAPRAWLGYQFAGGLGLRATWWGYDQGLPAGFLAAGFGLEATTVDLEVTDAINLGKWELLASGGLRYARLRQDVSELNIFTSPDLVALSRDFEGLGGTLALSVRRGLGGTNLALIGSARGSLVFGESFDSITPEALGGGVLPGPLVGTQRTLGIFEMRLGVEWSRELSNGARFYTQTVYEAQYWQSAQLTNGLGGMDVGFTGVAVNIGLAR